MQDGLVLRQTSDLDHQYLKQNIRRYVEDPQDMQEVQDIRWKQPGYEDMKNEPITANSAASDQFGVHQRVALDHTVTRDAAMQVRV